MLNKFLCFMWGHTWGSYIKNVILTEENFSKSLWETMGSWKTCKHCGEIK